VRPSRTLSLAAVLALTATLAGAGEPAPAAVDVFPYPVHQQTLDNGLKVVVVPYPSPGVVAYFTVARVGSRQEVEAGHSGFAHFFEHMMFRGTERYPAEAYNDVLKRMGADSNAFTTDDYTCYYLVGPAAELDTMADIESDRFKNLSYDEDAFKTEALAVLGEYNKNASGPFLPMYEKIRDLAFTRHTYKHTTMGFLADIKAMPGYYDYSLSFFERFYRPDDVVLLVVGDVDPQRLFALAKKDYGDWKGATQPAQIPVEPPQAEARQATLSWPSPTRPYLMVGYHVPGFAAGSTATAGLDLLDQLLTSDSAPLYRKLVVDEQWADQFGSVAGYRRDPGLYIFFARIKSNELVPKVEAAIASAVAELAAKPVDAARLDRIKSHLRYDFALGLDSPAAVAFQAANFLNLTGGVAAANELFRTYETVTPEALQKLAAQTFRDANRTTVVLAHEEAPPAENADGGKGGAR
jgi:zinc protease